jgi:meiotic recombination protein REC8
MLVKLGEHYISHSSHARYSLKSRSPEQLILQDDPSFLPDFALSPPELLADLDLGFNVDIARSDDSQSLTPFGSQHAQSSSQASALGGLVLPSSSPVQPRGFSIAGHQEAAVQNGFLDADDGFELEEPGFTFDENGELIEGPPAAKVAGTAAAQSWVAMHSDAGASEKVARR